MENKKIEIPVPKLFSREECLWFLNRNLDNSIYTVYEDRVRRAFKSDSKIMLVDVYVNTDSLTIEWLNGQPSNKDIKVVTEFVSGWFELDTDLSVFYKVLAANKQTAYMVKDFKGLRFIGIPDLFEVLACCIIGQQVNLTFTYKVIRMLVERYGEFTVHEGQKYYVFPTPERLAQTNIDELKQIQFSKQKAEYLITISQAFLDGSLSKELLQALPTPESRIKQLTSLRGIGQWTANYALMKSLKEPTCIPHGDAGLLNALINHSVIKTKDDKVAIEQFFKSFAGWESYLVFYLWRTLSQPAQ